MNTQMVWKVLGIQPTQDKEILKQRYHELLVDVNPEDDSEGFKRLREAYEQAVRLADASINSDAGEDLEEKPKDEIDVWLDKIQQIYWYAESRNDINKWKEAFEDTVCVALDTGLEARERFLAYLMSHNYLNQEIWQLIDKEFQITQDKEELAELFPRDFLDYIVYQVENENFMPYEDMEVLGLDEESISIDDYLREYFRIKTQIDRQDYEGCWKKLEQLKDYEVYHPYEDIERVRLLIQEKRGLEAVELAEKLLHNHKDDVYIGYWAGRAYWSNEQWEEAYQCWQHVMDCMPDHYTARVGLIKYYIKKEDYLKAKEIIMELLEINGRDEMVLSFMREVNVYLIDYYWQMAEKEPEVRKHAVEACWCMFQNEQFKETIRKLNQLGIRQDEPEYYDYVNMMGRCYLGLEDDELAITYLKKWDAEREKLVDDGSEKYQKRQKREGFIKSVIGVAYQNLKNYEQAEHYLTQGIAIEKEADVRHSFMDRLAMLYYDKKEYEKCIEVATKLIHENAGYYPAYLRRQMAYYQMHNGQKVVDDYYNAIEIFPNYYKPYLLAVEVFSIYRQYEDAKKVLDAADTHEVKQDMLMLWKVRVYRWLAEKKEDYETVRKLCQELKQRIQERGQRTDGNKPEEEVFDESGEQKGMPEDQVKPEDIIYEEILIEKESENYERALQLIEHELHKERKSYRLHRLKGDCLRESGKYETALIEYRLLSESVANDDEAAYFCGICQHELGRNEEAWKSFQTVLRRNPKHPRVRHELMRIYKERYLSYELPRDYEEAMREASLQIQQMPYAYYYIERGLLYMENYEFDEAIADYKEALELEPDNVYAYSNMGDVLRVKGEYEEAIDCYRKAIDRMETPDENLRPYSNMAKCYQALEDVDTQIEILEKTVKLFGYRKETLKSLAEAYRTKRQPQKAIAIYDIGRNKELLNPDEYYDYVAKVYIVENDLEKAQKSYETYRKEYRKLRKQATEEERIQDKADALEMLGVFYMFQRQLKKAIKYLKPSFRLRKKHHLRADWSGRNLALAYLLSHQYDKAEQVAKEVLDILFHERVIPEALLPEDKSTIYTEQAFVSNYKPLSPARLDEVARMYVCMRNYAHAEELLKQAETMPRCHHCVRRSCYDAWITRGYIEESKGNLEKALECYRKCSEINSGDDEVVMAILALERKLNV